MVWWLRVFAVQTRDWSSDSSTHIKSGRVLCTPVSPALKRSKMGRQLGLAGCEPSQKTQARREILSEMIKVERDRGGYPISFSDSMGTHRCTHKCTYRHPYDSQLNPSNSRCCCHHHHHHSEHVLSVTIGQNSHSVLSSPKPPIKFRLHHDKGWKN